jgi:FkbM family methyltransferase
MNMHFKQAMKHLMRKVGLDIKRRPIALSQCDCAELRLNIEFVIAHHLLTCETLHFVQVGANDGCTHDPLHRLVKSRPCRGILLEPLPPAFKRLRATYGKRGDLTLINAAIAEADGERTLFSVREDAPGPDWTKGLASFNEAHILKHDGFIPHIADYIEQTKVPCITFDTLFQKIPLPRVDLLQVDTEGYDAEILRLFDIKRRRPRIIQFEHRHLSAVIWNETLSQLIELGYHVAVVEPDTIAYFFNESA